LQNEEEFVVKKREVLWVKLRSRVRMGQNILKPILWFAHQYESSTFEVMEIMSNVSRIPHKEIRN
jgi:hypothetical protein